MTRPQSTPPAQPAQSGRILIIEDELPMRVALVGALQAQGYRVIQASDGESGLLAAREEKPDLILLDVMMPRLDGYSVCTELRRLNLTHPILILTAKGRLEDRVHGLDCGADDYLVKPFSLEELLARVRALLRRTHSTSPASNPALLSSPLALGEITLDFKTLQATRNQSAIHLTSKEWAMLRLLVSEIGSVVTRERFLDVVWGYASFPTTRTVDTHIASLRSKIEPDPDHPQWIQTVHGIGYRLSHPSQD